MTVKELVRLLQQYYEPETEVRFANKDIDFFPAHKEYKVDEVSTGWDDNKNEKYVILMPNAENSKE